jgi:hypothetical protein
MVTVARQATDDVSAHAFAPGTPHIQNQNNSDKVASMGSMYSAAQWMPK